MNLFSAKLECAYPVIKVVDRIRSNGMVCHLAKLTNSVILDRKRFSIPYIEDAIDYMRLHEGNMPERILIVAENRLTALKTAAYINDHQAENYDELDEIDFLIEEGDEEEDMMRIVPLKLRKPIDQNLVNDYVLLMNGVGYNDAVFFTELSGMTDIYEKMEAIGVCPARNQFIWIRPNQMKMPWVQKLLIDLQCDVLRIREPKADYYEKVLSLLLNGEPYTLAEDISPAMLVRKIRKRRGVDFKEEDIAWHLDRAAEHSDHRPPVSLVLEAKDFKSLNIGEKNPMETLEGLVGIHQVKQMVAEIAAVVHEELRNEKLGTLYKNMLFLGNPGTGKTTCSELLADIMAEEGDTNAVFVSATRRDLIGEYVGQTAPKVAKKFEEARGGVLFVDEAGFLTQRSGGAYVEEAVKEFVRYMELYPDVTVIFAMYPHEARDFLQMDAGLTSRISRVVDFADYTNEELVQIAERMLEKKGYVLESEARNTIEEYMQTLRKEQKKMFGNAREIRRLTESAIVVASMKHYHKKKQDLCITMEDIREARERLEQKTLHTNKTFGFKAGGEHYVN